MKLQSAALAKVTMVCCNFLWSHFSSIHNDNWSSLS